MLDIGFSEILLTSAIALVVLGPERLPKVARQVGQWLGRARLMARQFSEQLEREVITEELLRQNSKSGAAGPSAQAAPPHSVSIPPPTPAAAATPAAATPAESPPPAAAAPPTANSPELPSGADPTHTHQ